MSPASVLVLATAAIALPWSELQERMRMGCLGVHFALDTEQVTALEAVAMDERVEFVQEEFEEVLWSAERSRGQETDKAWDAIHRSLTGGMLGWENGDYPLNHVILGGQLLYDGDDYILSLKSPQQVRDVAAAVKGVTMEGFRASYLRIDPDEYGMPLSEEDFEYTWEWFQSLVEFYHRSAAAGYSVLFTASL